MEGMQRNDTTLNTAQGDRTPEVRAISLPESKCLYPLIEFLPEMISHCLQIKSALVCVIYFSLIILSTTLMAFKIADYIETYTVPTLPRRMDDVADG